MDGGDEIEVLSRYDNRPDREKRQLWSLFGNNWNRIAVPIDATGRPVVDVVDRYVMPSAKRIDRTAPTYSSPVILTV